MSLNFINFSNQVNSEHHCANDLPLLQTPFDITAPAYVFKNPEDFRVLFWKEQEHLPEETKNRLTEEMRDFCFLTPEARKERLEMMFSARLLTEADTNNKFLIGQNALFANQPIKAFTPLGAYAGRYIENEKWLEAEYSNYPPPISSRYTHACDPEGFPCICAYGSGNYMSLINDWRPENYKDLNEAEFAAQKEALQSVASVIVTCDGARLPFFISIKDVAEKEELHTDYGASYWAREELFLELTEEFFPDAVTERTEVTPNLQTGK